jgi:hypothetical protein
LEDVFVSHERMQEMLDAVDVPWTLPAEQQRSLFTLLDFSAKERFIFVPDKKLPQKVLIMQSRTSHSPRDAQNNQRLIQQLLAYAIRKMHQTPFVSYTRLILFHVNDWRKSINSVSDQRDCCINTYRIEEPCTINTHAASRD